MKWYDYILFIIIIILLIVILLDRRKEIVYYRIERDTTILQMRDTIIKLEKNYYNEKTETKYSYMVDSIFIYTLPTDSLFKDIMSRTRRILAKGFFNTNRSSFTKVRKDYRVIRETGDTTRQVQDTIRLINKKTRGETNSSERRED